MTCKTNPVLCDFLLLLLCSNIL